MTLPLFCDYAAHCLGTADMGWYFGIPCSGASPAACDSDDLRYKSLRDAPEVQRVLARFTFLASCHGDAQVLRESSELYRSFLPLLC